MTPIQLKSKPINLMSKYPHRIFTYGTLMSKRSNNGRIFSRGRLLGQAVTVEPYLLMDFGGFPGMYKLNEITTSELLEKNLQSIQGELWEINDEALEACDRLEGHPDHYKRTPIKVRLETKLQGGDLDDGIFDCETYFYQGAIHGILCDGKWPRTMKLQIVK